MEFKCKELSMNDDEDFGYTITFSDTIEEEFYKSHAYDEIDENKTYLSIQRSFPEIEFEEDYYTIELSDFDKSTELEDFTIEICAKYFSIEWDSSKATIFIDLTQTEYNELICILKKFTQGKGTLIIN